MFIVIVSQFARALRGPDPDPPKPGARHYLCGMRILGIGDTLDLGAMYLQLLAHGHQVRAYIGDPDAAGIMAGMVEIVPDWESQLGWVEAAGREGFIVFETAHHGAVQDALRARGFQVIGGSAYGDRLEADRGFGQQVMRACGMRTAETHAFDSFQAALEHLHAHPARYVYKPSGGGFASGRTFVGELSDGRDMRAYLQLQQRRWPSGAPEQLVLMERLTGVEVGVGAYFDGTRFLQPACLDWEHKRLFPGDLGEMTCEMGTLVTFRHGERLFAETLGRMVGPLRAGGYRGYININTIVDEAGVHPLELTSRFGYPGFAILQALQESGWDELFQRMSAAPGPAREQPFATRDGFALGVVLTVPPFPYTAGYDALSKGLPIVFDPGMTERDRAHLHLGEVATESGHLVTAGTMGYVMVVTGCGSTAEDAIDDAYRRVRMVHVPNGRYRNDIGQRFLTEDRERLRRLGWL
jgi:phosphoribosylamine--glycine ligase